MKSFYSFSTAIILAFLTVLSCKSNNKSKTEEELEMPEEADNALVYETKSMEFIGQDTIPSGWVTLKYVNNSNEPHFLMIDDYPDDKTIDTINARVSPPFDKGMKLIEEGKMDEAMAAFGELPEWFPQVIFVGGTGFVSPKHKGITTVKLDPGKYIFECYVKMPDGRFHSSMGMLKEIVVSDEGSGNEPPEANVKITISSTNGITYEGDIMKGKQTFEVYFEDQIVHENFVGHDINLIKYDDGTDLKALEAWINWATPDGFKSSTVPVGVTFLGGANNAPAGSTEYFEADLEPGKYAFIAEVPNSISKNMLKIFEVTD